MTLMQRVVELVDERIAALYLLPTESTIGEDNPNPLENESVTKGRYQPQAVTYETSSSQNSIPPRLRSLEGQLQTVQALLHGVISGKVGGISGTAIPALERHASYGNGITFGDLSKNVGSPIEFFKPEFAQGGGGNGFLSMPGPAGAKGERGEPGSPGSPGRSPLLRMEGDTLQYTLDGNQWTNLYTFGFTRRILIGWILAVVNASTPSSPSALEQARLINKLSSEVDELRQQVNHLLAIRSSKNVRTVVVNRYYIACP